MSTVHDPRNADLVALLKLVREGRGLTQAALGRKIGKPQSYVANVERQERRLDVLELFDWLAALDVEPLRFFQDLGWFPGERGVAALPVRGGVERAPGGVYQHLVWEGQIKRVLLEGVTVRQYKRIERDIAARFTALNADRPPLKNREAIADALEAAFREVPGLNPSDVYHHLVYRLYLREFRKKTPEQSWVRAGGEAMELFIERHYGPLLGPHGIDIRALFSGQAKAAALREMGLSGQVGDSKLDVALYGHRDGRRVIFGGIHSKASLAERVTDDVPCSEAMMRKGYLSVLYTFDAKSFPPPDGDLVNRGEFGTLAEPSDKRRYVEEHGSFDVCFSYNLRTVPSPPMTPSGKRILTGSFNPGADPFPDYVVAAWRQFSRLGEKG